MSVGRNNVTATNIQARFRRTRASRGWPGVTSRSTILPSRIVENASARPVGERDGLTQQLTVGGDAMIHNRAIFYPYPQRHASGWASARGMALGFILLVAGFDAARAQSNVQDDLLRPGEAYVTRFSGTTTSQAPNGQPATVIDTA